MHTADLHHADAALQQKLERIFRLRRTGEKVNWDKAHYTALLAHFGDPHKNLPPIIHVAGTNGKGSVIAIMRSILEAQGYRVHSYTSPHLIHVNERINLAGTLISNERLSSLIDHALVYAADKPLSFFEIITACAFQAFAETPADILLLEVGMGGRLDCTNVIDAPCVSLINRVALDHTEFLGDTITAIATEKAGIIRHNTPCIVGYQGDDAAAVIDGIAAVAEVQKNTPHYYDQTWSITVHEDSFALHRDGEVDMHLPRPALVGMHQVYNAALAVMGILSLPRGCFEVSPQAFHTGLKKAQWQGRLQHIISPRHKASFWIDSGHNENAARSLAQQCAIWCEATGDKVPIIAGMLATKDITSFLCPLLPHAAQITFVPVEGGVSDAQKRDVMAMCNAHTVPYAFYTRLSDALDAAITIHTPPLHTLICGSVYLAGQALQYFHNAGASCNN